MLTSFHFGPAAALRNRCFIVPTEHTKPKKPPQPKKQQKTQLICVCGEVSCSFLYPETRGDRAAAPGKSQASRKAEIYTSS